MRAALYARVSLKESTQDTELQLVPMRAYASARGWDTTEYVDRALASDLVRRTAWAQLLEDVRMRRVDVVLCWKIDRPFRSLLHMLQTVTDFQHHGVGLVAVTQPIDTTSPVGVFTLQVLGAAAEFERSLIRERVKEGMANARRRGARIGRPRAAERPYVASRLPRVRDQVQAGELSKRGAARRLGVGMGTLNRLLAEFKVQL